VRTPRTARAGSARAGVRRQTTEDIVCDASSGVARFGDVIIGFG
jgi:hypothetical protein